MHFGWKRGDDSGLNDVTMGRLSKLIVLAASNLPPFQLWVRTSSPNNHEWTKSKWAEFQRLVKTEAALVKSLIYRGTHLQCVASKINTGVDVGAQSKAFTESFDAREPFVTKDMLSWTKSRSQANHFAGQARSIKIGSMRLGQGFLHLIKRPCTALDVYKRLAAAKPVNCYDGTDELKVAHREQEILMPVQNVLKPLGSRGRVFNWEAVRNEKS